MPWIQYPRSPGHEVAGVIDEVGPNVTAWKKGQRVGVGWHGGHDFTCINCRRGDFINCVNEKWAGVHYDGGYAEYMVAPWEAVAAMPDGLDPAEAAPLLCAGITTFNALRRAGAIPGDLVAVLGVGGLGHLGVQFANKFGYKTVAISRGKESEALAKKLGAHVYLDSSSGGCRGGAEETWRSESNSLDGAQRQSDVGAGRRTRRERHDAGDRRRPGSDFGHGGSTDFRKQSGERLGVRHGGGFRRHVAIFGVHRRAADDREIPARKVNDAWARMVSGKAQFRVVLTM